VFHSGICEETFIRNVLTLQLLEMLAEWLTESALDRRFIDILKIFQYLN